MDDSKLRFGVGVLVIAAIGIGIILTFLFGAFPAILNDEYTLQVYFPSAAGINTNTPVLRDGVTVGRVEGIKLRDEGGVILTLAMDAQYTMSHRYIPQIGIGSLITGDSKLEFRKSRPSELMKLFAEDPDMIERSYTDGEYFAYGEKLEDPFTLLFGMEDELRSTFKSVRGAGDAVQDIGQSLQGLVRDVRDVIGIDEPPPSRPSNFPGTSINVPQRGLATTLPPAPSWAKPAVIRLAGHASGPTVTCSAPVQTVAFQEPGNFQPPFGSPLQPGLTPRGVPMPGGPNAAATGTQPTIRDLTAEAIDTLEEFQGAIQDVRRILGDEVLQRNLSRTVEKFPGAIDQATETLQTAQETFESFRDVGEQFEQVGVVAEDAVESVQDTLQSFRGVAENVEAFTEPLGQRGGELVEQVLRSLANVDNALIQLDTFGQTLNNGDGTFRRLIEDDELYFEVRRVIQNVEMATAKVRPILDDVRVFTDKIARDPRQLGVRGALDNRPSGMGLK